MGDIAVKRMKSIFLHNQFLFDLSPLGRHCRKTLNILHAFSNKVITDRRQELSQKETQSDSQPCFLDLLIKESFTKPFMTDEVIREEVDTFMFAVSIEFLLKRTQSIKS